MESMAHGVLSTDPQEHVQANPKQFALYSYTGNISDYDDDEIFCSIDRDKADDLIGGILNHPFLQSRSGRPSKRRRFEADVRNKAIQAGMDPPTTEALLFYVDKLCTEKQKRFLQNKAVVQDEGDQQRPSSEEKRSTKKGKKRKRENRGTVDDGPVEGRKQFPVDILRRHEIPLDALNDDPAPRLPDSPVGHRSPPLTARDVGDEQNSSVSNSNGRLPSDEDVVEVRVSSSRRTERNYRKRAARKAKKAQRRASSRTALATSSNESPLRAGQNSTREVSQDSALSSQVDYIAHPDICDTVDVEDVAFLDNSGF